MRLIFFCILILSMRTLNAAVISGKITDEKNQPLPFVIVYIQGTTIGTTANIDGNYTLELKAGEYNLAYRLIGFKLHLEKISITENSLTKNVQMIPEAYQLKEVMVKASSEDPAYEIIRHAQKKRKFYLNQVKNYSCDAYVKSTEKITSHPKKILGQDVDLTQVLDSTTGIVYLSESVSKFYFSYPDRTKEVMVSSRVSGNNRSFSFNRASDLIMFNMYESLIRLDDLSERGFVSPVSPSALFYYKFRLEGTYTENGETVNKIKVIPKRPSDPVFQGDIYILDDSWRIHSTDLFITKAQQIEFIDTLEIHQSYVPVEKDTWMNFSNQLNFVFSVFGFHGRGVVLGINSNYNVHPDFSSRFFNGEVMKINADANKKDSSYWQLTRPVPLIAEEVRDYHTRDSTAIVYASKHFRDSVDKKENKFTLGSLLFSGYRLKKSFSKESFSFTPLVKNIQFNTAEGLNVGMSIFHTKRFKDDPWSERGYGTTLRYGFANKHFNESVYYYRKYNPDKQASYSLIAGTSVSQFNANRPITELINTAYSLLAEKNFMKIYEKRFFLAEHQAELFNGFRLETSIEYANRFPLINRTNCSFIDVKNREYTSNDPLYPVSDSLHFKNNKSVSLDLSVQIHFRQEYINSPEGKFILGSKYPSLKIHYRKGIKDLAGSDVDYDFVNAGITDEMRLGLLGTLNYSVSCGKFMNRKALYLMDDHHFNGNQTFLSSFRLDDFKLLNYYQYSTTDPYVEAHGEQNFGGFILNKIPFIRKLKLTEVAGIHYLYSDKVKNYMELSVGLQKLSFVRIDFVTSFADSKKASAGFVFGLKGNF